MFKKLLTVIILSNILTTETIGILNFGLGYAFGFGKGFLSAHFHQKNLAKHWHHKHHYLKNKFIHHPLNHISHEVRSLKDEIMWKMYRYEDMVHKKKDRAMNFILQLFNGSPGQTEAKEMPPQTQMPQMTGMPQNTAEMPMGQVIGPEMYQNMDDLNSNGWSPMPQDIVDLMTRFEQQQSSGQNPGQNQNQNQMEMNMDMIKPKPQNNQVSDQDGQNENNYYHTSNSHGWKEPSYSITNYPYGSLQGQDQVIYNHDVYNDNGHHYAYYRR